MRIIFNINSTLIVASFVIGSVLFSSAAQAEISYGGTDCGQWLEHRKGENAVAQLADTSWLAGFLSGLNTGYSNKAPENLKDPLTELQSLPQAFVWMDNYCKAHPLEDTRRGAMELFFELIDRKKKA